MVGRNAKVIVNQLLNLEQQESLLFIWSKEHCDRYPFRKYKWYKDFKKSWSEFSEFDASNTQLFDDAEYKASKQPANLRLVTDFSSASKR
jgi:hypothetical protein